MKIVRSARTSWFSSSSFSSSYRLLFSCTKNPLHTHTHTIKHAFSHSHTHTYYSLFDTHTHTPTDTELHTISNISIFFLLLFFSSPLSLRRVTSALSRRIKDHLLMLLSLSLSLSFVLTLVSCLRKMDNFPPNTILHFLSLFLSLSTSSFYYCFLLSTFHR